VNRRYQFRKIEFKISQPANVCSGRYAGVGKHATNQNKLARTAQATPMPICDWRRSSDVSAIAPARYLQRSGYRECMAPKFLRFIIEIRARRSPLLGPRRLLRRLALFYRSGLGGLLWCSRPTADKNDHDFLLFEILFMLGGNRINYQQA
jgi:hypothetical protein